MDESTKSILDLNVYCMLEIMEYIIADCELDGKSQSNKMNYLDLVSFALAHEGLEAVLKNNKKNLYKDLEFLFVENRDYMKIDFAELQSAYTGKAGDVFWRYFADAIKENRKVRKVRLFFTPKTFQPDFLDHFQMIKCALGNKWFLCDVKIDLNGYSLDDLNNFGHVTTLDLNVRMSAEVLVSVCQSNPELRVLKFMSAELQGRLSDIVPHCRNLHYLEFVAKPDVDVSEYAPLTRLPNLEEMTIHGAFNNDSMLTMFEAVQKCQRSETYNFKLFFCDELPHLSSVTFVGNNSFHTINLEKSEHGIRIKISYKFMEISEETSPSERSLATISLIDADLEIESTKLTITRYPTSDTDISELSSLLRQFNIETLILKKCAYDTPVKKILVSISKELVSLKSINISGRKTDKSDTIELVKIKSITSLQCRFSDWECVELLKALIHLETVDIIVEKKFDNTFLRALCYLLKTCKVSSEIWCKDFRIQFMKQDKFLGKINSLTISDISKSGSLNDLLEAFANTDLITIEELHIPHLENIHFKDFLKVAEIQTIRKLSIRQLADSNGIEKLSELTQLVELTISHTVKGSLIKLFDQLATMVSPSLQCLHIKSLDLSPEEVLKVSRIKSLKKLALHVSLTETCVSLTELANSNIEEVSFFRQQYPIKLNKVDPGCKPIIVYRAFASKSEKLTTLTTQVLSVEELNEITRIKSLKTLTLCVAPINQNLTDLNLGELPELESLDIEFIDDKIYKNDIVLAILNSCRNLDRVSITYNTFAKISENKTWRDIHTLLKSIRDPALQGPLTVFLKSAIKIQRHILLANIRTKPYKKTEPYKRTPIIEDAFLRGFYMKVRSEVNLKPKQERNLISVSPVAWDENVFIPMRAIPVRIVPYTLNNLFHMGISHGRSTRSEN